MRLSLRFVLPLMLVLAGIAYAVAPLVDQLTLKWFVRDLDIRAALIANAIQEPLQEQLAAGKKAKIGAFFARTSGFTQSATAPRTSPLRWPAAPCRLKSAAPIFRAGRSRAIICLPAPRVPCTSPSSR